MIKNYKIVFIFLFFLLLISYSFFNKFFKKEKVYVGEASVEYVEGRGFVPEKIIVKKGTIVHFLNKSSKSFWPASDFYPSDSNYPEFNSKENILKDKEWSFKFDNLGTWGYHNDFSPIDKGVVVVTDGASVTISNSDCGSLDSTDYTKRQICWYNQIKDVVKKQGVSASLKLVSKLYNENPSFAQGCHDATHLIGDEAYRQFRKGKKFNFSVETTYCGYGFYHGFIEAMLYTTGDYTEVRNFCESINSNLQGNIESPNAIYSCYHGIGHSTFDAHDPSLWGDVEKMVGPAIKLCEKVTVGLDAEKTKQCVTGVFNALANAYSTNTYHLKMNPNDPVWYCRKLIGVYKKACFTEVAMAWINTTMGNFDYKFSDGAHYIQSIHDIEGEKSSMFSLSSDYVRMHMGKMSDSDLIKNCQTVRKDLYPSCIQGTQLALLNWGKPTQEYLRAIDFCSQTLLSSDIQKSCYGYLFNMFPSLYTKEKRLSICDTNVPDKYRDSCLNN